MREALKRRRQSQRQRPRRPAPKKAKQKSTRASKEELEGDPVAKFGRGLESYLVGGVEFVGRFIKTAWDTIFRPSSVIKDLTHPPEKPNYVRPYTFFILACLLGGNTLNQTSPTDQLQFGGSFLESLESRLQLSSPVAILGLVLPIVVAILLGARLLSFIVGGASTGFRGPFVKLLCLCSGCQLLLMMFRAVAMLGYSVWKKATFEGGRNSPLYTDMEEWLVYTISGLMLLSACLVAVPAIASYLRKQYPNPSAWSRLGLGVIAVLLAGALLRAAEAGASQRPLFSSLKRVDRARVNETKEPNATIVSGTMFRSTGATVMTVAFRNQTDYRHSLAPSVSTVSIDLESNTARGFKNTPFEHRASVSASAVEWDGGAPLLNIDANRMSWIKIETFESEPHALILMDHPRLNDRTDVHVEFSFFLKSVVGSMNYGFDIKGSGMLSLVE